MSPIQILYFNRVSFKNLIQYINNKTQTFITTTDLSEINFDEIDNYSVFHIEKGIIKESKEYGPKQTHI
jgi:hypothetical protein